MGAILAVLMALDIITGSSIAKGQSGEKTYDLSSSSVRSGSDRYTYTDDYVRDSSGRTIYEIKNSSVRDSSGRVVFSVRSKGLSGSDNYEVRNDRVYRNNRATHDLN